MLQMLWKSVHPIQLAINMAIIIINSDKLRRSYDDLFWGMGTLIIYGYQ